MKGIKLNLRRDITFHKNIIDKKIMSPILGSRILQNFYDTNSSLNIFKKSNENKIYLCNDLFIKFNKTKEKNLLNFGNNDITEEKTLNEDLLSDDTKSSEYSSKQIVNFKENFENEKNDIKNETKKKINNLDNNEDYKKNKKWKK